MPKHHRRRGPGGEEIVAGFILIFLGIGIIASCFMVLTGLLVGLGKLILWELGV